MVSYTGQPETSYPREKIPPYFLGDRSYRVSGAQAQVYKAELVYLSIDFPKGSEL